MNTIEHYGKLGMHWGIKHGPPYPIANGDKRATKILKQSFTSKLDDWGKSVDKNILFVSGYSGSGKSTVAKAMLTENVDVIHLDSYFQESASFMGVEGQNLEFNRFLTKHNISFLNDPLKKNRLRVDAEGEFQKAIERFGRAQFKKKRKVIVEGVELLDSTMFRTKGYFNDKPLILTGTSSIQSMRQAFKRDERGGLLKGLASLDSAQSYISWYRQMHKEMKDIKSSIEMDKGSRVINKIFKKINGEKEGL